MAASEAIDYCAKRNCNNEVIDDKSAFQRIYEQKLQEFYDSHAKSEHNVKKPWTSDRISEVIEHIKKSRVSMQRESSGYYWSSKYDIMETSNKDFLIFKKKSVDDPTIRVVSMDEYFDILTEVHLAVGHGGREKMIYCIKNRLHIPKKAIEIYIKLCAVCEMNRSLPKKVKTEESPLANEWSVLEEQNFDEEETPIPEIAPVPSTSMAHSCHASRSAAVEREVNVRVEKVKKSMDFESIFNEKRMKAAELEIKIKEAQLEYEEEKLKELKEKTKRSKEAHEIMMLHKKIEHEKIMENLQKSADR